ncbi:MAG: hypothetical protein N2170_04615 [Bacteroidia bacterium]|nr:hypothetical protein [Bacteroidia bacterium]
MISLIYLRIPLIAGLVGVGTLFAQNAKIKKMLDQAGLKYTVDSDGDFKLTFGVGNGRSQLLYIMSTMEEMGGQSIVEIWSPAYKQKEISDKVLVRLLSDSYRKKIGAWEVTSSGEYVYAVFKAKVPLSSLNPEFLRAVCEGIVSTADEIEKDIMNGSDDF